MLEYLWSADFPASKYYGFEHLRAALSGAADGFGALADAYYEAAAPYFYVEDAAYMDGLLKACSDAEKAEAIDGLWVSAADVAALYYPEAEIVVQTNENLYDADAGFAAACDELAADRADTIDDPVDTKKRIINHNNVSSTNNVYYTVEEGQLIKHVDTNVIYNGDAVTVLFTRVELRSAAPHEHAYGEPVWSWAEDHGSATATFTCACGEHAILTDEAPARIEVSAATATEDQIVKYTAKVTLEDVEYTAETDPFSVPGTATGTPEVPDTPDKPDAPDDPDTPTEGDGICKWCGQTHEGFFGKLVGFFHSVAYFFAHLFGKR